MKKRKTWIVISILLLLAPFIYFLASMKEEQVKLDTPLENFIWHEMVFENQTLKTHFKPEKEAYSLSESLGLWMEYAVLTEHEVLFEKAYQQLNKLFLSQVDLVHWRVLQNGEPTEYVNALLDDLRIVNAMLDANELWGVRKYKRVAKEITSALVSYGTHQSIFIDFYDWEYRTKIHSLSLVYLDVKTIRKLHQLGWVDTSLLTNMEAIALTISKKEGPLYPTVYDVDLDLYIYSENVNMIEQVYTAYHLASAGYSTDHFYRFIKNEFIEQEKLFGQYEVISMKPSVNFESPALYGISIIYALSLNDHDFALMLYNRMKHFQLKAGSYQGAYMDTEADDTHIFDNLLPLIAERRLKQSEADQQ